MALAIAAPTMPSTIFMIIPMLLFMNCSASQPAIPPMMMAAIQPTPALSMAHLLAKAHGAPLHVVPKKWLTIDLYQPASTGKPFACRGEIGSGALGAHVKMSASERPILTAP